MTHLDLNNALSRAIRHNSGLEDGRLYLGMSSIGRCARQTVVSFLQGRHEIPNDRAHQTCERGYLIESRMKHLLRSEGALHVDTAAEHIENFRYFTGFERELVAPFDERFKGHIDGETADGELLEIKSMLSEKYGEARMSGRIQPGHYAQVQCYMRYGGYDKAHVIYVDSSTFDHWDYFIALNPYKGDEIESKARRILAAIDAADPSAVNCECGRCGQFKYPQRQERVITAR